MSGMRAWGQTLYWSLWHISMDDDHPLSLGRPIIYDCTSMAANRCIVTQVSPRFQRPCAPLRLDHQIGISCQDHAIMRLLP